MRALTYLVRPLLALLLLATAAPAQGDDVWLIREVRIGTRDVFAPKEAAERPLYDLFNSLHRTTREQVIARQAWFGPGDRIGEDQRAELERNLRRTGLFGAAEVRFEPTGVEGEADLIIDTRDRFSLVASATGSLVGGVGGYSALIGERNLFGSGDSLSLSVYGNDEDETEVAVDYTDRYLFGSWHRLDLSVGETEEGPFAFARVKRPFMHLRDTHSWSLGAGAEETAVDYFIGGDSVAEVPRESLALSAAVERGYGPPDLRGFLGLELRHDDQDFGVARGPQAGAIAVPGDLTQTAFGPTARFAWVEEFRKVRGIDTLDFVQDLTLGVSGGAFVGPVWRDEAGARRSTETLARANLSGAFDLGGASLATADLSGSTRLHGSDAEGWRAGAAVHVYNRTLDRTTFAASFTYDQVFEGENLPVQLNLGEDNGLRGYPAREFAGDRRYRVNLEGRHDTGLAFSSFHLGLVAFADAGWIGFDDVADPYRSVGFGLRIGSSEVLGSSVLRMDVGFPLDDDPSGDDYGTTLSIAFGQVFDFFGNSSTLATQ